MLSAPTTSAVLARVEPLARRFRDAGHDLYLVGGVVRDLLLGHPSADLDLTTDARPAQTKAIIGDWADDRWTQGERFGTIGCRRGGTDFEITTYRAEVYDPASRKPLVEFGSTLEGDLVRRDFTINAMAIDPLAVRLVDPHDGIGDLDRRRLRTPGPAEVSFDDDPLRMLRAARFVARFGLSVEPEVREAMGRHAPRLAIVSAERIHGEVLKLLAGPDPHRGLALLAEVGLLDRVLGPVPLDDAVLARTTNDPLVRLAVLLRDRDAEELRDRLRAMRFANHEMVTVTKVVALVDDALRLDSTELPALRRLRRAAGSELDRVHAAARAIDPVRGAQLHAAVAALAAAEPGPPLRLDGAAVKDLLGLAPGPDIGEALALLDQALVDEGPLSFDQQRDRLRRWWATRSG